MHASDLGERALVRRITQRLASQRNLLGLGDDCAALPFGGTVLLATTDTLAASTHFPRGMAPRQAGHMAAAANLSDLAAKGGEPLGLLLALGLPPDFEAAALDEVVEGFAALCEAWGCEVLGGDTKPARELTLAVTALGEVPRAELLPRTGIKPGDLIAVTGSLGGAAAGMAALRRGLGPGLAQRLLEPQPRLAEGRALAKAKAARACMDISDGLAASLHQLAALNPCGFVLEVDRVPLDPAALAAARSPTDPWQWAVQGGGDYELLAALAPDQAGAALAAVEGAGGRLTVVGRAERGGGVWQERNGKREPLPDEGWEHFRATTR